MKQALVNMLNMQDRMNSRVHENWVEQGFEWYRALWIECGELLEHYGYKWWKKQEPDLPQVQLEVIDIWHFGMSALLSEGKGIEAVAAEIERQLVDFQRAGLGVRDATEALALHALETHSFSPGRFWELLLSSGLDFDTLYSAYVGKNVLNFFRQDNGYKEGTYSKNWDGREDNEHLADLVRTLDKDAADFAEQVYRALDDCYRALVVKG